MRRAAPQADLDLAYYLDRLIVPAIADRAVPIEIAPSAYEPAVPWGPGRTAGHLVLLDPGLAHSAVAQLQQQDGFPGLRLDRAEPGHGAWPIEWGQPVPEMPACGHRLCTAAHHLHAGLAYGYRPRAIRAFLGTQLLTEF